MKWKGTCSSSWQEFSKPFYPIDHLPHPPLMQQQTLLTLPTGIITIIDYSLSFLECFAAEDDDTMVFLLFIVSQRREGQRKREQKAQKANLDFNVLIINTVRTRLLAPTNLFQAKKAHRTGRDIIAPRQLRPPGILKKRTTSKKIGAR